MLPQGDPNEAVSYNFGTMSAVLACGAVVPFVCVDVDGNEIEDDDPDYLRSLEKIFAVTAPTPSGAKIIFAIHSDDNTLARN